MPEKKKYKLKQVEKNISQQFFLLEETKASFISHGKMIPECIHDRCVPPSREHGSW